MGEGGVGGWGDGGRDHEKMITPFMRRLILRHVGTLETLQVVTRRHRHRYVRRDARKHVRRYNGITTERVYVCV